MGVVSISLDRQWTPELSQITKSEKVTRAINGMDFATARRVEWAIQDAFIESNAYFVPTNSESGWLTCTVIDAVKIFYTKTTRNFFVFEISITNPNEYDSGPMSGFFIYKGSIIFEQINKKKRIYNQIFWAPFLTDPSLRLNSDISRSGYHQYSTRLISANTRRTLYSDRTSFFMPFSAAKKRADHTELELFSFSYCYEPSFGGIRLAKCLNSLGSAETQFALRGLAFVDQGPRCFVPRPATSRPHGPNSEVSQVCASDIDLHRYPRSHYKRPVTLGSYQFRFHCAVAGPPSRYLHGFGLSVTRAKPSGSIDGISVKTCSAGLGRPKRLRPPAGSWSASRRHGAVLLYNAVQDPVSDHANGASAVTFAKKTIAVQVVTAI